MTKTLKIFIHVLAGLFGISAILFGVAAWRLSTGPVSIAFLSPYIEDAFGADDLSYRLKFDDTVLIWNGWGDGLDIIITDGEFETQQDADEAASFKARRGNGINSYVLNLCPEASSEIQLPSQFRVIPLNCIYDKEYNSNIVKDVDKEALRNALYSIVIDELVK